MRLGVSLFVLGLGFHALACSGDYPLAPTRCDEWCHVTKGGECEEWYGPASCVSRCEESNVDVEACRAEFDASIQCFRTHPNAASQQCVYDGRPHDCELEKQALAICVSPYFRYGF